MAHTLVQGLRSLFFARPLLGMGEGSYYPAAMRGAAGLFPPASRAKAVGTILSAISLGMLLRLRWWRGQPFITDGGRRFCLIGSLGLLLLPPWLWVHRANPARGGCTRHRAGGSKRTCGRRFP